MFGSASGDSLGDVFSFQDWLFGVSDEKASTSLSSSSSESKTVSTENAKASTGQTLQSDASTKSSQNSSQELIPSFRKSKPPTKSFPKTIQKTTSPSFKKTPTSEKKRKLIQTVLDLTAFEGSKEGQSIYCMGCNQFISLSEVGSTPTKLSKKASQNEWKNHLESTEHKAKKDLITNLNVLCFETKTCKHRFNHLANAFCLMSFHKMMGLAKKEAKNARKARVSNDDLSVLEYFAHREMGSRTHQHCEKSNLLKQLIQNSKEISLRVSLRIWGKYGEYYEGLSTEEFGEILCDIIQKGSEMLFKIADIGLMDPQNVSLEDPFGPEELGGDSDDENEDSYPNFCPHFTLFMKMYMSHFFMVKPVKDLIEMALNDYHDLQQEELEFEEWEDFILQKQQRILKGIGVKQQTFEKQDNSTSSESDSDKEEPKPQTQTMTLEDLLFGSQSQATKFDDLFSNIPTKQPLTKNPNSQNASQTEDAWSILMNEELQR